MRAPKGSASDAHAFHGLYEGCRPARRWAVVGADRRDSLAGWVLFFVIERFTVRAHLDLRLLAGGLYLGLVRDKLFLLRERLYL
jgi:hypothetical protein